MSTPLNTLQYAIEERLLQPSGVELHGEMLTWHGEACPPLSPRTLPQSQYLPIYGCLNNFLRLRNGSPEDVFDFVKKTGVLGIAPLVQSVPIAGHLQCKMYKYTESVIVYKKLAALAYQILTVMDKLRQGEPVKRAEIKSCFHSPPGFGYRWHSADPQQIYDDLLRSVGKWRGASDFRISFAARRTASYSAVQNEPYFYVSFRGLSHDFFQQYGGWDAWAASRYREGDRIAGIDGFGNPVAEDFPYHEFIEKWMDWLPGFTQRPSPLFSALTFKLLLRLSVPEGYFFCGHCKRIYNPSDPKERANGAKPPRKDRISFCSNGCREANKKQYWSLRSKAKKAGIKHIQPKDEIAQDRAQEE